MSHLDPYSSAEPYGWDRQDQSAALPWPERDPEPGQWARNTGVVPDLYAEPHGRPWHDGPYNDRHDAEPHGRPRHDDPYGDRHAGPYGDRHDDPYGDRRFESHDDWPARANRRPLPTSSIPGYPDADGEPGSYPVGHPGGPGGEPERPSGRRRAGRRRASAERPPTHQGRPSRAGRNLPAAIAVGLGLGAAIVLPLFLFLPAFPVVVAAAVAVGSWEMVRAVRRSGAHPPLFPLIAGGVLTVGLAWWAGPDALSLGLLVTVLATMVWRLADGPAGYQRDLTAATLIAVYVPFLGGFTALLAAVPGDGNLRVLVTLVAVVLSDTGGYAAGATFGKHPMAPSVSPKKSWEGFAGSVTAAALGSALLIWLLFDVAPGWGALFGLAVSGAAVLGDLAESMIKRDLGVKDMSNLLPGHGGLMDRLDSILFAVPTAYLLLAIFVPAVG